MSGSATDSAVARAIPDGVDVQSAKDPGKYEKAAQQRLDSGRVISATSLGLGTKITGKVRDIYDIGDHVVLVATDRLSAFDRNLTCVPYKGQVLNQVSLWWFEQTKDIVPNHIVASPHPNLAIVKKCEVFPIEFVVRGFITGSTSTSMWTHYNRGVRSYCGHELPEGLVKNQRLDHPLLTPTTKEAEHDRPISAADIVKEGWMSQGDWDQASAAALRLFEFGQKKALERGLLLVDTKYELGRDPSTGRVVLVDEIHTPDSSRYWLAQDYEARMEEGKSPANVDKEFLRLWYKERCDPYKDVDVPAAPRDLVVELSRRYCMLFEMITGGGFDLGEEGKGKGKGKGESGGALEGEVSLETLMAGAVAGWAAERAAAAAAASGRAVAGEAAGSKSEDKGSAPLAAGRGRCLVLSDSHGKDTRAVADAVLAALSTGVTSDLLVAPEVAVGDTVPRRTQLVREARRAAAVPGANAGATVPAEGVEAPATPTVIVCVGGSEAAAQAARAAGDESDVPAVTVLHVPAGDGTETASGSMGGGSGGAGADTGAGSAPDEEAGAASSASGASDAAAAPKLIESAEAAAAAVGEVMALLLRSTH